jgi:hypothetical protein
MRTDRCCQTSPAVGSRHFFKNRSSQIFCHFACSSSTVAGSTMVYFRPLNSDLIFVLIGERPMLSSSACPSGDNTKSANSSATCGCGAFLATPMAYGRTTSDPMPPSRSARLYASMRLHWIGRSSGRPVPRRPLYGPALQQIQSQAAPQERSTTEHWRHSYQTEAFTQARSSRSRLATRSFIRPIAFAISGRPDSLSLPTA